MNFSLWERIALVAAVIMPLFNIPLIVKIIRRRSSKDLSLSWLLGVWSCILLMAPAGLRSEDVVWRAFNGVNLVLFTGVVFVALRYYKRT